MVAMFTQICQFWRWLAYALGYPQSLPQCEAILGRRDDLRLVCLLFKLSLVSLLLTHSIKLVLCYPMASMHS